MSLTRILTTELPDFFSEHVFFKIGIYEEHLTWLLGEMCQHWRKDNIEVGSLKT